MTPATHIEQPQHTRLSDLRNHVLDYMIQHLSTGPYAQGPEELLVRENAPIDFGTEAQGDPRRHLSIGLIYGDMPVTLEDRARPGTSIRIAPAMIVGIGYRLGPQTQDEDYGKALDLLQQMPRPLLEAISSYPVQVNPLPQQMTLSAAPVPRGSPYIRLLVRLPILAPVEV